ncbi:Protein of unknown function [Streptomyces sp. DvalAA-14]|uniref:DUF3152 domain-containing protein n=1 Tax=unclassified Streptomyces TaxID=2593676 RepID=UPI00081BA70A|nr:MULTISPECIES: DUF3152 domain-containing protein [unclassified Streptomyces]MYS20857.1 DUF3152 domain-containing protein [Streptomyces sp. SID4948]SCD78578.1 Protein of unknown function [Streptomyces sp. DvalAA-14]
MAASRTKSRAAIAGPLVILCVIALGCGAAYAWHTSRDSGGSSGAIATPLTATSSPVGRAAPDAAHPVSSPRATPSTRPTAVPKSGTGRFTTAHASGKAAGHGEVRRYKVEVEGGIDLSATDAANEISSILADPRGWTADGHDAFRLVSSGPVDFVIKIATPDTVDAICGAAGLQTEGEVNCDVGATVVVNLKRWELGSPEFSGPIDDYRALIINHEVGHRIGHGHEGCPGPGKLAPVMMQQIKGLHGCIANAWPYDRHGHYLSGPPTA